MTNWILNHYTKSGASPTDPTVRANIGKAAGSVGMVCNLLLFAAKMGAGLLTGAVSIVADALNNLSDVSSSLITLVGFRLAQRPADEEHPYGHARYEYLSGLAVAALILVIGLELAKTSFQKILHPENVTFSALSLIILLVCTAVKVWMAIFYSSLGKKIGSTTLKAASADSKNDVITTMSVLAGCVVYRVFDINIDGFIGLGVSVFILYSGMQIANETISPLIGAKADQELCQKLDQLILRHPGILGIHDLLVHDYGPGRCFASVHVEVSASEDVMLSHDLIDDIEQDALRELNVQLVIHHDPVDTANTAQWQARQKVLQILQQIDPALSVHDFRLMPEGESQKMVFDLAIPYAMSGQEKQIQQRIQQQLQQDNCPYKLHIHFDHKA